MKLVETLRRRLRHIPGSVAPAGDAMTATRPRRSRIPLLPPRGERLLPALSGLLLAISFPPVELLVPPFVALVPLLLFIATRPTGREGRWSAARAGFLTGVLYFGLLLYWLIVALIYYSALAVPAYLVTVVVLAGSTAVFAGALHYVLERTPVPLALAAPILWTALEWIPAHLGDLAFPWLGLGTALASFPRLAGAADLIGARGLTFWLALVNGLVAVAVLRFQASRPIAGVVGLATAAIALPAGYGIWRAHTLDLQPAARVALVQPNIPEDLKMDRPRAIDSTLVTLSNLMPRIPPGSVDLVVWPEVTLPAMIQRPNEGWVLAEIQAASARVGAPIVAGAYGIETGYGVEVDYGVGRALLFNSAFLVTPEGIEGEPYHKQFLVPFVERIPLVNPRWLESIIGDVRYFGGLARGESAPVLGPDMTGFGVLICYESIFARLSRSYRMAGAEYLVNITNDAWYGREPWYTRTSALWQHPSHLPMRAIEQRIGIARAANTGISLFVDPLGRRYDETELFEPAVRVGTVYTTNVVTLYTRWGDWLATAAALAAVLLLVAARTGRGNPSP